MAGVFGVLARVPFDAGRVAERLGRPGAASAAYGVALRLSPDELAWRRRRAGLLASGGRWAEAAAEYADLAGRRGTDAAAWRRAAEAFWEADDPASAGDAYDRAVALEPGRLRWQKRRARAHRRARQWAHAAEAYGALAEIEPGEKRWPRAQAHMNAIAAADTDDPAVNLERARAAAAAGDWPTVAAAAELAIIVDPKVMDSHYLLGTANERLHRMKSARRAYRNGLRLDPTRRPIDELMAAGSGRNFAARRVLAAMVEDNLDDLRAYAAPSMADASGPDGPGRSERSERSGPSGDHRVFVYWAQGFDQAPPIVRMCHDHLVAAHDPGVVVALDNDAVRDWVDIPADVDARASRAWTQYSDLVRTELLARYGGSWVDATCLVTGPVTGLRDQLATDGWFTFRYRETRMASWFITAEPDHHIARMMRAALHLYWRTYDEVLSYFLFHDMYEALCHLDAPFGDAVAATPLVKPRWELHDEMRRPYDEQRLAQLLDGALVHKLSHKRRGADQEQGTMLAHLLAEGVPPALRSY